VLGFRGQEVNACSGVGLPTFSQTVVQCGLLIQRTVSAVASLGSTAEKAKGVHIPEVCFGPIAQRRPVHFFANLPAKTPVVISARGLLGR